MTKAATPTLPLPQNLRKTATNLWLTPDTRAEAAVIAKARYKLSLSELVDQLLHLETSIRGGILKRRYR